MVAHYRALSSAGNADSQRSIMQDLN